MKTKGEDRGPKMLGKLGQRVQYSVFLLRRGTTEEVASALSKLIVVREDNVRIHVLCATCEAKAVLLGQAREAELPVGFRVV